MELQSHTGPLNSLTACVFFWLYILVLLLLPIYVFILPDWLIHVRVQALPLAV